MNIHVEKGAWYIHQETRCKVQVVDVLPRKVSVLIHSPSMSYGVVDTYTPNEFIFLVETKRIELI